MLYGRHILRSMVVPDIPRNNIKTGIDQLRATSLHSQLKVAADGESLKSLEKLW